MKTISIKNPDSHNHTHYKWDETTNQLVCTSWEYINRDGRFSRQRGVDAETYFTNRDKQFPSWEDAKKKMKEDAEDWPLSIRE